MDYFSDDLVQYYDLVTKTLLKSQKEKTRKFIENNCIEQTGDGIFIVKPIRFYNSSTYTINISNKTCNCQWNSLNKKPCSHIFAVIQFIRRNYCSIIEPEHHPIKKMCFVG